MGSSEFGRFCGQILFGTILLAIVSGIIMLIVAFIIKLIKGKKFVKVKRNRIFFIVFGTLLLIKLFVYVNIKRNEKELNEWIKKEYHPKNNIPKTDDEDREQTITVKNRYSVLVPIYMKKLSNLNKNAALQYGDAMKELYLMIIDEPKSEMHKALERNGLKNYYKENLVGYSNFVVDNFNENSITINK